MERRLDHVLNTVAIVFSLGRRLRCWLRLDLTTGGGRQCTLDSEHVADLRPTDTGGVGGQRCNLHRMRSGLELLALASPCGVAPGVIERTLRFGKSLKLRAIPVVTTPW
jgi:hypothetical protein